MCFKCNVFWQKTKLKGYISSEKLMIDFLSKFQKEFIVLKTKNKQF